MPALEPSESRSRAALVAALAATLTGAVGTAAPRAATAQQDAPAAALPAPPGSPAASGPLGVLEPLDTPTLPDAKPGECYAKVVTAPVFAERSEEIVVQESSERIETLPARFRAEEQRVAVREPSTVLEPVPATFETVTERVRTRPREIEWSVDEEGTRPASPHALAALADAGVDVDGVAPGACFVEHYKPATWRAETQRVLTKEASVRIEVEPATFETVEERVVVREAATEIVDVPAVFRTETERVLVEPARSVWRPGRGPVERIDDTTGEIMCLVEIPARYETLTRTVLDTPATTETVAMSPEYEIVEVERLVDPARQRRVEVAPEYANVEVERQVEEASFGWTPEGDDVPVGGAPTGQRLCLVERPAEYRTVEREIVASDATVELTDVPAEYRTVPVQRLEVAASVRREPVPERVETVTTKVQIQPSTLVWRPVLCETNMTREIVADLQRALARAGFDPGPPDGVVGRGTLEAIEAYQRERSLDRGGITYQTLQSLGVEVS